MTMTRVLRGGLLALAALTMCGCPHDPVAVDLPAAPPASPGVPSQAMEAVAFAPPVLLREEVVPLWVKGEEVPFAAYTVLVPEGWSVLGGATSDEVLALAQVDVRVVAPDGRQARVYPGWSFEYHSQEPQPEWFTPTTEGRLYHPPPASLGQWFVETARSFHREGVSDLALIDEARLDAVSESLHVLFYDFIQQVQANAAVFGEGGSTQQFELYAARAEIGYQENGQAVREAVLANVQRYELSHPVTGTAGSWLIGWMRSVMGPEGSGYADDPVLQLVVDSLEPTRSFDLQVAAYWQWVEEHRAAVGQPIPESFSTREPRAVERRAERLAWQREALDRCMRSGWGRGGEDAVLYYTTPSGQVVALPQRYAVVFSDGGNRLLLHEDAGYRPGLDDALDRGIDWGPLVGRTFLEAYPAEVKK